MRFRIEVDETPVSALLSSVSIEKELDGRTSKATFKLKVGAEGGIASEYGTSVYDSDEFDSTPRYDEATFDTSTYYTALPAQQSEIIIYDADSDEKHFRGTVVSIAREIKAPTFQWWTVTCVGLEGQLERISVNRTYTAKTARYIIQDVFDDLFPEIATTNATVENLGSAMDFEAKDLTLRALLDRLAELVDAEYRVTPDKELIWRERGSVTAAYGFDSSPDLATTYPYDSITQDRQTIGFANRVIALGGFYGTLGAELRAQADDTASQTALGKVITAYAEPARDINNQAALDLYASIALAKSGGVQEYVTLRCHHGSPDASRNVPSVLNVGDVVTVRSVNGGIAGTFTLQSVKYSMKSPDWTVLDLSLGDYNRKLAESSRKLEKIRKNPLVPPVPPPPNSVGTTQIQSLAVTNAKINSVDFSKVTSVSISDSMISSVSFSKVTSVSITNSQIVSVDFSKVTSVVISNSMITSVDFSKVTSVSITGSQIASLTITGGNIADSTIGNAKITDLDVSKLTAGTISAAISISSGGSLSCAGSFTCTGSFNSFTNGLSVGSLSATGISGISAIYAVVAGSFGMYGGGSVIDSGGVFVGAGVNTPAYGHAASGFNPYVSGVQYYGYASGTFTTVDGKTATVKGGIIVDLV